MAALIPYCYKYSVLILYVFWPDVQQKKCSEIIIYPRCYFRSAAVWCYL